MRQIALIVLAIVLASPLVGAFAFAEGPVDQAKAWEAGDCVDGIGLSFTKQQQATAMGSGQGIYWVRDIAACGNSATFFAQCGPPTTALKEGASIVVCGGLLMNRGLSKEGAVIALDDFLLLSNTGSYTPDRELSGNTDPLTDIVSQAVPFSLGDDRPYVVAFDVPADVANEDLVLQWSGAGPVETAKGELPGLQVIVSDREPTITEAIYALTPPLSEAIPEDEAPAEELRFSGASDEVIGPLDLTPGLYQVTAQFSGDGYFALWVRQADGTADLLINHGGSYRGEVAFSVENPNKVVLEVIGIGEWELRLERLM